ncbi:PREDICTED: probable ADP-ribosylation factor GTPase-activating protein AGD14 [Tarenaya hassleriana]|uniref:probable ADP-ribosylation factor GTPase-activating protein AGD14 n=1 Tax=Tarenaya hassleriana TaxID=28532 RepID=UPI00053C0F13|nr:PREDICTED: probable ADP-ribosylation factor GTPase-activating protein AGD14 [Tarenaya hassleriana]XP_019057599.1 PREDICTED: probable ADP-ribosylation factor GTPase-activating protein AGD14 [Tarenaya hassleriana]
MASRLKEDEKNERVIRGLLKLPENKRCINCNSLGPQYVCTTFWTFVCTNCSGIHREFTHRVKSVSMAKFTSQEVGALQEGGNQRAKEIYFKGFDLQRQSLPDGSNVERLRDFIRHVYVNKRYMGEKNDDKPPRGQMGDKNDFHGTRSPSGAQSPQYEDAYDRRYSDRSDAGGRSPGFEPGSRKFGDYTRSPSRPEIVNDWRREDRFGSGRKSEEGSQSPDQGKNLGSSPPPVVRPIREILGDSVVPLRVGEPPKPDGNRNTDASAHAKRTVSSSSLSSANENPPEVKVETSVSLIDFDADPEPPASTQMQQSTAPQPVVQSTTSSDNNWASFDTAPIPSTTLSQAPANGNTVDSLLSQLAVPSSVPVQTSGLPSGASASIDATAFPASPPVSASCFGAGNSTAPVSSTSVQAFGQEWPNVQQQSPSLLPMHVGYSTPQNMVPPQNGPSKNQPWNTTLVSNVQRSQSAPALQPLQGVSQEATPGVEVKPSGRKELPVDLFTATYPSYHAAAHGWQAGPPHGMGFGMQQYNTAMFQNFQQPPKSMNPFDFGNEPTPQTQTATQFMSMSSLQGALPPMGMTRTSSLGTVSQASMPPQAHHHLPSGISYQVPSHPSALPPRFMSPQMPGNMPPSIVNTIEGGPYGGTTQHFSGPFSGPPSNPPSFPTGGNPFG